MRQVVQKVSSGAPVTVVSVVVGSTYNSGRNKCQLWTPKTKFSAQRIFTCPRGRQGRKRYKDRRKQEKGKEPRVGRKGLVLEEQRTASGQRGDRSAPQGNGSL